MFAVIFLPDFPLQAVLRHEPELWTRPVALVDPNASTPRIIAATPPARLAAVIDGLTPPQALARCREVLIRHRSLTQEAATLDAVLQVAFGFSPNLENTSAGLVTLDLHGLAELTDPTRQPAWATRLQSAVSALGLRVHIGVGATPNLARHAALWSGGVHVVGNAGEFIARLPVAALEPTPHVAEILEQWGVRTVGEFLALGQAELADRLGLEALALFAAASPTARRPLQLIRPAERFEESWDFEQEVETVEPVLFLLRRFVDGFSQRLESLGLAAEQLVLRLRLESGETLEQRLRLPEPTRQPDALFRTLQTHLESVRTTTPVVSVALSAEPTRPRQRQFSLFEAAVRDPHQFQETLARLSALVGADRVGTPVRENSHRPDAFRLVPPDFENAPTWDASAESALKAVTPMRRLRPPRPVRVEVRVPRPEAPSRLPRADSHPSIRPAPMLSPAQIAAILSPVFRKETTDSPPAEDPLPHEPSARVRARTEPGVPPVETALGGGPSASAATNPLPDRPPRDADLAAGTPAVVSSRVASGRVHHSRGPWRISGQWWESTSWSAEEWEVELERGETVRLTRRNDQWTLDALAD